MWNKLDYIKKHKKTLLCLLFILTICLLFLLIKSDGRSVRAFSSQQTIVAASGEFWTLKYHVEDAEDFETNNYKSSVLVEFSMSYYGEYRENGQKYRAVGVQGGVILDIINTNNGRTFRETFNMSNKEMLKEVWTNDNYYYVYSVVKDVGFFQTSDWANANNKADEGVYEIKISYNKITLSNETGSVKADIQEVRQSFSFTIDKTADDFIMHNTDSNGYAIGDVTIDWVQKINTSAITVFVNNISYTKGTPIKTIKNGIYNVLLQDKAGNKTLKTLYGKKESDFITPMYNYLYYETIDSGGSLFSFDTYEKVVSFASAREQVLIRQGNWTSGEWDGGLSIDEKDLINAAQGKYYIYKKEDSKNTEVAYFTLKRLNEVIEKYAQESVKSYYYFQKTPSQPHLNSDIQSSLSEKNIYCKQLELNARNGVEFFINGNKVTGTFNQAGQHNLRVIDTIWSTTAEYNLIIVRSVPMLKYKLNGSSDYSVIDFNQNGYYLKSTVDIKAEDLDPFAMYELKDESGTSVALLAKSDVYKITKSGKYFLSSVNHYGRSLEVELYISINSAKVVAAVNDVKKKLEINVYKSTDKFAGITNLYIDKSKDGGMTWLRLSRDDYGKDISTLVSSYAFKTSGLYRIKVEDKFRNGLAAVVKEIGYSQAPPSGALYSGGQVFTGMYTNRTVTLDWVDEAQATVRYRTNYGETQDRIEYVKGAKLDGEGYYELSLFNDNGDYIDFVFIIDKTPPQGILVGVNSNKFSNTFASLLWEEEEEYCSPLSGSLVHLAKETPYENGFELTENGDYVIKLVDMAGNETRYSFSIDKIPPTGSLKSDGEELPMLEGLTNKSVTFYWTEKATATLNGQPYLKNTLISAEGVYIILLTDLAGNVSKFTFEINKSIPMGRWYVSGKMVANKSYVKDVATLVFDEQYNYSVFVLIDGNKREYKGYIVDKLTLIFSDSGEFIVEAVTSKEVKYVYILTVNVPLDIEVSVSSEFKNDIFTNGDIILSWKDSLLTVQLNGAVFSLNGALTLSEEGKYTVVFINSLGSKRTFEFYILKTPPSGVITDISGSVINGGNAIGGFTVAPSGEYSSIAVYRNGELIKGDKFSQEGEYDVIVFDAAGNYTRYKVNVQVPYQMNAATIVLLCVLGAAALAVGVFFLLRKLNKKNPRNELIKKRRIINEHVN